MAGHCIVRPADGASSKASNVRGWTDFVISKAQTPASPPYRMGMVMTALILQAGIIAITRSEATSSWRFSYHFRRGLQGHWYAEIALLLFVAAWLCKALLEEFVVVKSSVCSITDPAMLRGRSLPQFIQQDRSAESLLSFRKNLEGVLAQEHGHSLAMAVAIRRWVRRQQAEDERMWRPVFHGNHEDPQRLLDEQRQGVPGACRRFSYIFLGALLSAGLDARIVCFTSSLRRRGLNSHVMVEVWIEELRQWVLMDPTYDTLVLVDGNLASALELQAAVVAERHGAITFDRGGGDRMPHPSQKSYGRCCRHLFVGMSNATFDGYAVRLVGRKRIGFLHYSPEARYPVMRRRLLLSAGASGLCLSAMFWIWTALALRG
jgi:hypothetical protein